MFHIFQTTESRQRWKKIKKKNRRNIKFALITLVGSYKKIEIKYGTKLRQLDDIIKKAYDVKNDVKLIANNINITKQENKEQPIGSLINAIPGTEYTMYVVFVPLPPPPPPSYHRHRH